MKHIVLGSALALLALPALANQFDQLYQIEQETKQAQANAEAERIRQATAEQARAEARDEANRRQRAAAQQAAAQKAAAQRQVQETENKRIRTREEGFEDELRALELEERRLELQAKRARAARALNRCLESLDGMQRQSITVAYFQGLSCSELAEHLAAPLGSVKSWIRRGMERLRRCLES